ncbi:Armadillo repeat-containing protein 7 [Trachymyrmex cornetzi]|uniref:Armadillo repeat-containing protein 7 n=1 Tax=Trachymyrmex cornetzi TaxID=471704 RepID=A0A151J6C6_9HYME|nr:Armadillo repeat-containing protein 7 [Trachymyrmex cornetzi]
MFSSRARLTKRTGKNPTGRYDFLKLLVTEYTTTSSKDAQEQVLANLANFAYDPVNYGYMRQLKVIDIFLNALSQSNPKLVRFGIAGLCNLCLDGINKLYILRKQGVESISSILSSEDEDVLLGVITTLMFLITPESVDEITSPKIIKRITKIRSFADTTMNNLREGDQVSVLKVITNDDILKFAELTGDHNPIHTESARNIAHGALLNGLVSGLIGTKLPGAGTVVIEQNITFPKPCYAGDTVEVIVKITSIKMYLTLVMMALCISYSYAENNSTVTNIKSSTNTEQSTGCACAIFLSGQFKKGSKEQPKGYPALIHEYPDPIPCTTIGNKHCVNKCLEIIVKHLPNSQAVLCASIDRDCHKERAYLFFKNCKDEWINTNLSAGKEYCCKDGMPYKC